MEGMPGMGMGPVDEEDNLGEEEEEKKTKEKKEKGVISSRTGGNHTGGPLEDLGQ